MKKTVSSSRGFTLIELLVVIAIIGILSGIVLVNLRSAQVKARDTRRASDVNAIVKALQLYYDKNKVYPTDLAGLVTDGQILGAVPEDPRSASGTPIVYAYAATGSGTDCNGFHLGATFEDSSNDALRQDSDADNSAGICTGSDNNFSGTDPVYDIKQ